MGIRQSIDATCGSPTGTQTMISRHPPADVEGRKNSLPPPVFQPQGTANQVTSSSDPIMRHVDSGVRLRQAVVEIPPPYSET